MADVMVPEVGESITEGLLVEWSGKDGEYIGADEPLFVLETDKITLTVETEVAGTLKILVQAGETVKIGQKVAEIDTKAAAPKVRAEVPAEAAAETKAPAAAQAPRAAAETKAPAQTEEAPPKEIPAGLPQAKAKLEGIRDLSPAVRRLVEEKGLDPVAIAGTGKDGRLTKADVLASLDGGGPVSKAPAAESRTKAAATRPADLPDDTGPREERVRMSPMRQRIAERLIQAQQNAAILTTFNEIDMSHLIGLRAKLQDAFLAAHAVKLGFMSFFVKASIEALRTVPEVNARIEGDEIVYNRFFNIGVAVGTEYGLVVPVVRDADRLDSAGIEKAIAALAEKAQNKTLDLSDLQGGVFTISNGGIYGNMLSTPILNPPQSGILGMHAIKKRPVVIEDKIEIRPIMYVALSYDHRIVDGREAVTFLKKIVECIENPERLLLET